MSHPFPNLTTEQIDAFGEELDDLRRRTVADLGDRDREYLDRMVRLQRGLEAAGRSLMFAGFLPPAWLGGVTALSLSKILDNMEIGHNVMHGQYDFLQDPDYEGQAFDWDNSCPGDSWRRYHNFEHHTYTNILGKDRDVGYGFLRVSDDQKWEPHHLLNPFAFVLLATFFQYGIMLHELEVDEMIVGDKSPLDSPELRTEIWDKLKQQTLKDYVLWPALTGPMAPLTFVGNATANFTRNLWAFSIIFCGHFPEGVATFTEEEAADESRGGWYLRQILGSANIEGGSLFHVMSGNLSHQIEHHLFPDLPAHRYAEMAVEVREICERYGVPYNTGGFAKQFGSVVAKVARLALPWFDRGPSEPSDTGGVKPQASGRAKDPAALSVVADVA
ncbi:MAG: acyl-CoA desaturase [Aquihabitans sp.]